MYGRSLSDRLRKDQQSRPASEISTGSALYYVQKHMTSCCSLSKRVDHRLCSICSKRETKTSSNCVKYGLQHTRLHQNNIKLACQKQIATQRLTQQNRPGMAQHWDAPCALGWVMGPGGGTPALALPAELPIAIAVQRFGR